MQNAAFAGMGLLRGLYPVHKSGGLQAAAGVNTTVMPAKRQKSASTPTARPSAAGASRTSAAAAASVFSAIRCHQLQCPSTISFLLSDSHSHFSKKMIPQNYRNGNFENNFPLLNNIIWELVFFTLLWYHFFLCSEQIYSALYYLLANNGAWIFVFLHNLSQA